MYSSHQSNQDSMIEKTLPSVYIGSCRAIEYMNGKEQGSNHLVVVTCFGFP